MAYNFKSIADVEVVAEPNESANVLIEEDGVIKKAPKTAIGGGSGALIVCTDNNDYSNVTAPDWFYDVIDEMYNDPSKAQPIICYATQGDNRYFNLCNIMWRKDGYYELSFGYYHLNVYSDGSFNYYYYD